MSNQISHQFNGDRADDWETPADFFEVLHAEFGFTVDAAASSENAKCLRYFTKEQDGLGQPWTGEVVWCNPPYGAHVGAWMQKALDETGRDATTVLLVYARTDVRWFHDIAMLASEIRFIRGRLNFARPRQGLVLRSPYPSMLVIFRPGHEGPPQLTTYGARRPTQRTLTACTNATTVLQ